MAGTREGGLKASKTNRLRHGANFYKRIGKLGGKNGTNGGFGSDKIGEDGLTGRQRASVAGAKGGAISKRGKAKPKARNVEVENLDAEIDFVAVKVGA